MKGDPIAKRLLDRVEIDESGCCLWTGAKHSHGYGEIYVEGVRRHTHRISFGEFVRPLQPGEFVLHRCDVPACINPDHLFAGTQADNVRDMHAKGRARGMFQPTPRPACGSVAAYASHQRHGEPTCTECRAAMATYRREWKQRRRVA